MGILVGDSVGKFVHVRLAKNNCAGALELRDRVAVLLGYEFLENRRSCGGADAARPEIVFDRDGNATKKARRAALFQQFPGLSRFRARVIRRNGDEGIDERIHAFDARESKLDEFRR